MRSAHEKSWLAIFAACTLIFSGCQYGDAPQGTTGTLIQGQAVKGVFQPGATVTAVNLNNTAQTATGAVIDTLGNYRVSISWTGPTRVDISGPAIDEFTGALTNVTTPLRAIVPVTAAGSTVTGQVNLATSIAAAVLTSTKTAGSISNTDVADANTTVARQILGASSTATLNEVSLTSGGAIAGQILAFQIAVLAQAGISNAAAAVTQLANNVVTGSALGSAPTTGTSVVTSAQINTNIATIAAGGALTVSGVGTVSTATVVANSGTGLSTATVTAGATTNQTTTATTLRGFAVSGNGILLGGTVSGSTCSGGATGTISINSTPQAVASFSGSTSTSNVVVCLNFLDFTNSAGTGPATGTTYPTVFTFKFVPTSTSDKRTISGTVSQVNIVTTGSSSTQISSVSVPAGTTLSVSGTDVNGTAISASATNLVADTNFFQTNGTGGVAINFNTLLTLIQNKLGLSTSQFQNLSTAGTYTITFGFSTPFGTANSGNTGIQQLFPQSTTTGVSGYTIIGQVTLT
jgi:hypothetical protein